MRKISFCLIVFLGSLASILTAQNLVPLQNPDEFLAKLKESSKNTQTLQADFTEEKFLSYLKEPQKSTGVFYYKKENMLRWEKIKPTPYILIIQGNQVKLKENGKEVDVSSFNQMMGKIKELMISLINGDFHKSKAFVPRYFSDSKFYVVNLIPKSSRLAKVFDHIQLTFYKDNLLLKELTFFEKSGDKSVMRFYNDKVNESLSNTLFTDF